MKRQMSPVEAQAAKERLLSRADEQYGGLSVLDHYVLAMLPGFLAKGGGISDNSVAYLIRKAKLLAIRVEDSKFTDPTPDAGYFDEDDEVVDGKTT